MIRGPRLTVREMKRRDWQALADALPRLDDCKDLQRALKFFASGYGWQRLEGLPGDETGRRYLRQIRQGLAGRPYQAGPFRVEMAGRWGLVFVIDPAYAAQNAPRQRSRSHSSGPCGWDERFQRGTEAAQELFERGRRLVTEHAEENPIPTATDMPTDNLATEPDEDWWLCSHCKSRCPEDPSTGLPMACHCGGEE